VEGRVWRKECVEGGEGVEGRVWREVYIVWKGMWGGVHGMEGMWGRCTWCGGGGVHGVEGEVYIVWKGMWGRCTYCGGDVGEVYMVWWGRCTWCGRGGVHGVVGEVYMVW